MQTRELRILRLKRLGLQLGILCVFLLTAYFMRFHIARYAGSYLSREDKLEEADAIFVLSGNAQDRGRKAARLMEEGFSERIICTGSNPERKLESFNIFMKEGEFTAKVIDDVSTRFGSKTEVLYEGTSTFEESEAILKKCKADKLKKIIIVSDKFHLRRIRNTFEDKFKENGIQIFIVGAQNSAFDEVEWWETESGLIAVNNEYMKLLYYFFKY